MIEDADFRDLLTRSRTIAVVGLSMKPHRDSYRVAAYMQDHGYRIVPVNPTCAGKQILGEIVYPSLQDVPVPIDIVDVFRRSEHVPPVAEDALGITPKPKVFWMQVGIENAEAAQRLGRAGIGVVQDECLMVVHRRLLGRGR